MEEKRNNLRAKTKIKSEVKTENHLTYSTARDLSHGGVFISTPEPLSTGSEVSLSIQFPGTDHPVEIKGIVKWERSQDEEGHKTGMGIEFTNMDEDKIDEIKKNLKS